MRKALIQAVSPEDVRQIARKLADMAKAGNIAAATLLFERLWGKAPAAVAVADVTPDGGPGTPEERRARLREFTERIRGARLESETVQIVEVDDWYGTKASIAERFGIEAEPDDDPPELARDAVEMPLHPANPPSLNAHP
ncbi:MAG: hypothetical protein IT428_32475 [Planctomycetaceae bacterium]|nr:hypothetical protein [Planctomycetaceae bacterium]